MIQTVWMDGEPSFASSVRGVAIYLDNCAIISLAKDDADLRQRFVETLNKGADLLFSMANAVEVSGLLGYSSIAVKSFLNELGANWYPVEMVPHTVMQREAAGLPPSRCCLAEDLLKAFFKNRTYEDVPGSARVIDLSAGFFQLGAFVEWLAPQRDHLLNQCRNFDDVLMQRIPLLRAKHKRNPGWLDREMPQPQFDPNKAATYAFTGFMRDLICDSGYQLKRGDGMDFCHALMASAFSTFAALDKQWKRRAENLPKPYRIPRIYYEPELRLMIGDIETAMACLKDRT